MSIFDMLKGKQISASLPRSWKKSFDNGIVIPLENKRCNEWKDKILCDECNIQIIENKKFEANLSLRKRDVLNQCCPMLPYYKL